MSKLFYWLMTFTLIIGALFETPAMANELVRGKVVEITSSKFVIRLQDGSKKTIHINTGTKFMHKAGSGEQSEPPKVKQNTRVAVSLDGNAAAFVVVEEIPK